MCPDKYSFDTNIKIYIIYLFYLFPINSTQFIYLFFTQHESTKLKLTLIFLTYYFFE